MSVDQTDRIDAIGVDKTSGDVVLTITDHLPWTEAAEDHLLTLQEKINTYLAFVESGELFDNYPDAAGKRIVITVVGKHDMSDRAAEFFERASSVVGHAGMTLRFERFDSAH